jgi:hypothetical protein
LAGEDKLEFPPLLPPGFHPFDLAGLRRLCVDRFPASIVRRGLMDRLEAVISLMQQNGMRGDIWIDGSFVTEKLNPYDVDLMLWVKLDDYRRMTPAQLSFFNWFRTTSLKNQYKCDNYGVILDRSQAEAEYMFAYWLKQFGFSRSEHMKGLAVIKLPFLVMP